MCLSIISTFSYITLTAASMITIIAHVDGLYDIGGGRGNEGGVVHSTRDHFWMGGRVRE